MIVTVTLNYWIKSKQLSSVMRFIERFLVRFIMTTFELEWWNYSLKDISSEEIYKATFNCTSLATVCVLNHLARSKTLDSSSVILLRWNRSWKGVETFSLNESEINDWNQKSDLEKVQRLDTHFHIANIECGIPLGSNAIQSQIVQWFLSLFLIFIINFSSERFPQSLLISQTW